MDISNRFSLEDFLAYLFPGVIGTLGIYILLLLTPLQTSLINLPIDFTTGIIFLVLSYIVGILLSCFPEWVLRHYEPKLDANKPKDTIPLQDDLISGAIKDAFKDIFKLPKETELKWCKDYFYLCRSLVFQSMSNVLQPIQRQSGLRQLRMNLLPTLLVWGFAGIGWGVKIANDGNMLGGIALIAGAVVLSGLLIILTFNRMQSNEQREVREVLTAFLVGYQTGAFKEKIKS
jgi:hypothetical protein